MSLQLHQEAIKAAEELDASELAVLSVKDKPLIDWELAELGRVMKIAQAVKRQADRAVRLLEEEQSRRLAELHAAGSTLEKHDAGFAWFVKHPQPKPSRHQMQFLLVFQQCLQSADRELIKDCYNLCLLVDAHITSWRTDSGEALEVAYARRMKELEAIDESHTAQTSATGA